MDIINIEILEDGTVKTSTGKVSMANHSNAESALRILQQTLGGKTDDRRIGHSHGHHHHHHHDHDHDHDHDHGHEHHTH